MNKKPKDNKIDITPDLQKQLTDFKSKLIGSTDPQEPIIVVPKTESMFGQYGPPLSPREFIEKTGYFNNNLTDQIRPWVIDTMEQIFSGDYYSPKYQTVVVMAGKGAGKSTLSSLCATYMWYWYLSFNSFKMFLKERGANFDDSSTVAVIGMAKHRDQVKRVFFDQTAKFINQVQAFRERDWLPEKKIKSELRYTIKDPVTGLEMPKFVIIPGNSSETFALGYNVLGAVIDEAEFFAEKKYDPVEDIYKEINTRRYTRFKNNGLILMISSARVDGTFVSSFEGKAEKDPSILFIRKSGYDCDPSYYGAPRFDFQTKHEKGDGVIVTVNLRPPVALKPIYDHDPYMALRDFDAIPGVAGQPFYADYILLTSRPNKSRIDPCPDKGQDVPEGPNDIAKVLHENTDFRGIQGAKYRIHCDLSKGDMVKGQCGCGFAMTHKVVEPKLGFKIFLDLAVRFKAPQNKEIQIPEILELIKFMKNELKFDIDLVSFDQYQCLCGESTCIPTSKGFRKLKEVEINDLVLVEGNSWKKVLNKTKYNSAKTLKLTTESKTTLEGTLNHKLKVSNKMHHNNKTGLNEPIWEWKKLEDIKIGDILKTQSNIVEDPTHPVELKIPEYKNIFGNKKCCPLPTHMTEDLAEFLGLVYGDGHISEAGVDIACNEKEIECIKHVIHKNFKEFPKIHKSNGNGFRINYHSRMLVEFFTLNNITKGAYDKKLMIPEVILNSGKKIICAFLRGLFSADGNVDKNDGASSLSSCSKPMVEQVKYLIQSYLGVRSTISDVHLTGKDSHFNMIGTRYQLRINGSWEIFYNNIGYLEFCPKKELLHSFIKTPGREIYERVLKIEESMSDVYDIEVEGDHLYVANGIISHNSDMAIQTINGWGNGFHAERLPVDYKHHAMLKTLIYSGQLDMFEDTNLLYELKRLEDFGTTIDHAPGAYKDEADAVAGAAFSATMLDPMAEDPTEVIKPRVKAGIVLPRGGGVPMVSPRSVGGLSARYRNEGYRTTQY